MGRSRNAPPRDLAAPERATWVQLSSEYELTDGAALVLLEQLCRNLQLSRECRAEIQKDGKLLDGRPHPLLRIGIAAERAASTALRSLNLDLEPLNAGPGRPPGEY
jgi:hypothetical protein